MPFYLQSYNFVFIVILFNRLNDIKKLVLKRKSTGSPIKVKETFLSRPGIVNSKAVFSL